MSGARLRVVYEDGEPQSIKLGRQYFGDPASLAYMEDGTAFVSFNNVRGVDFEAELLKLPFVEEVDFPE